MRTDKGKKTAYPLKIEACNQQRAVAQFHRRIACPEASLLELRPEDQTHTQEHLATLTLRHVGNWTATLAKLALTDASKMNDNRLLRAHLILEEASECVAALADRDEVNLLDGLADLYYVTLGAAVTYDLPLMKAFWKVHFSNMTKRKDAQAGGLGQDRVDGNNAKNVKSFKPPDICGLLVHYRAQTERTCYGVDGDKCYARRSTFINLQESPCGFGNTHVEALANLQQQEQERRMR